MSLFLLLALSIVQAHAADTSDRGVWNSRAPAPTARTEVAAAAIGTAIYVVGGFERPSVTNVHHLAITPTVERYDVTADTWTTVAPLPVGLHHVGIAVLNRRLYVIGGFRQALLSVWKPVASVYVYDPAEDQWSEGAPMPTPRGALAVTVVADSIYAIGGVNEDGNAAAVEQYDPVTNTWTTRSPLPTPRDHLAAATVDGRLYAIGGRLNRDYGRNLSATEMYVPAADSWFRRADIPTPRSGVTAAALDGLIYVLGGEAPEGTFAANEAYDPREDQWLPMAPMPTARHGLGSAVVNGNLYVLSGGPKPGGSFSDVNEVFTPPRERHAGRIGQRATPTQVGTIMALLAAFQDAGALPPQDSPEANRLIKTLIQTQSALMKTDSPALRAFLDESLADLSPTDGPRATERFQRDGWTSASLEAVLTQADARRIWDQAEIVEAFRLFGVTREDVNLLAAVFRQARRNLADQEQDLHRVYQARRQEMPGAPASTIK